jgi:hypothetical protein
VIQESKYLYEIEIERIQSLMGVNAVNEQVGPGFLLNPIGGMGGSLKAFNWFKSFNEHDWLTFVDITTGLLGMFPTPAAPFLLGASLVACQADAALYFKENDPYMGGLVLSFCLIPLGEWIRVAPGAKSVLSKGKQYVIDLLKKAKSLSGKKFLNPPEKVIIKEADILIKSLTEKADEIAKLTQKYFVTRTIAKIIATGGKPLASTALLLSKMSWAIGRPVLQLAGIYYTFDEVYLAMYGTDEQKMKLRFNSGFQKLVRLVKLVTNQESIEKQYEEYVKYNEEIFKKNPDKIASVNYEEKQKVIDEINQKTTILLSGEEKNQPQSTQSPSFTDVLSKKINPITKQPYTIREGQKGESVKKIQEMLEKLEFGSTLRGYDDTKDAVDGDFGENTFSSVVVFQRQNNLKETGEVDSETLKVLNLKIQEKNEK